MVFICHVILFYLIQNIPWPGRFFRVNYSYQNEKKIAEIFWKYYVFNTIIHQILNMILDKKWIRLK